MIGESIENQKPPNDGVDAAARVQIDNRQLEIGNDFTLPPLRSNELFGGGESTNEEALRLFMRHFEIKR